MAREWTSQDAWVFAALGGTSAESTSSLSGVIARADAIEHAVLEKAEFVASAARLIAAELVGTDGTAYWHTDAGREIYLKRGHRQEALLKGLRKWGEPPLTAPLKLRKGEFRKAADGYLAEAHQATNEILRNR